MWESNPGLFTQKGADAVYVSGLLLVQMIAQRVKAHQNK